MRGSNMLVLYVGFCIESKRDDNMGESRKLLRDLVVVDNCRQSGDDGSSFSAKIALIDHKGVYMLNVRGAYRQRCCQTPSSPAWKCEKMLEINVTTRVLSVPDCGFFGNLSGGDCECSIVKKTPLFLESQTLPSSSITAKSWLRD